MARQQKLALEQAELMLAQLELAQEHWEVRTLAAAQTPHRMQQRTARQ